MSSSVDRHFGITRTLLGIIGLWPYYSSIFAQFQFLCFSILVTTAVIFQFATFLTSPITTELVIDTFSIVTFYCMSIIKYYGVYANGKTIKCLMKKLYDICDNLSDKTEIAIIEKYGFNAKRYPVIFLTIFIFAICTSVATLVPDFLRNATSSAKKSRQRTVTMTNSDYEIYCHLKSIYLLLTTWICFYVLIATGTMFITYIHFFCGIFKIASYRVDQAMKIHTVRNSLRNDNSVYRSIIYASDLHQRAMIFSKNLIANFDKTFMVIIASSVLSLSLNMFCTLLYKFIFKEVFKRACIIVCILLYLLFANLMGQAVIDHYGYIFATAYTVQWYIAPVYIQKLLLFLLQKGQKAFGLNSMGKFFTASLPCFATLINASLSYFTVMYSVRL